MKSGDKKHKLTFLENDGKKRSYIKCVCECGSIVEIQRAKFGTTKSCGCLKHEKKFKERTLIGNIFGKLTVLKEDGFIYTGTARKRRRLWLCKCECGKELDVSENSLLSKNTKSCGCILSQSIKKAKFVDHSGKRFGRLVVLEFYKKENKNNIWKCQCDCGNISFVRASNLLSNGTKSCGCLFKQAVTKHGLSNNLKAYTKHLRSDPIKRLKHQISNQIRKLVKKNGFSKNKISSWKILPYTSTELKQHLESLWEPWMNWDNYGGRMSDKKKTWHIDHIVPQSKFYFNSMDDVQFKECWALSNLRPLEKFENRRKSSK